LLDIVFVNTPYPIAVRYDTTHPSERQRPPAQQNISTRKKEKGSKKKESKKSMKQ